MKQYCLALDLKDDQNVFAEYEEYHKHVSAEIKKSITDAGIIDMILYRTGNRLFMIIEATDNFSFDAKAAMDAANNTVQEWEALMWKYQQPLPWAKPGEKWIIMDRIFKLRSE